MHGKNQISAEPEARNMRWHHSTITIYRSIVNSNVQYNKSRYTDYCLSDTKGVRTKPLRRSHGSVSVYATEGSGGLPAGPTRTRTPLISPLCGISTFQAQSAPQNVSVQSRIDAEQRRPRAQSKPKKSNPAVRPFDHHGIADGVSVGVGADAHHTGLSPQGPASPVRQ